ncbi:hypothetical protein GVAV_001742 [Gurleya vavrai]
MKLNCFNVCILLFNIEKSFCLFGLFGKPSVTPFDTAATSFANSLEGQRVMMENARAQASANRFAAQTEAFSARSRARYAAARSGYSFGSGYYPSMAPVGPVKPSGMFARGLKGLFGGFSKYF